MTLDEAKLAAYSLSPLQVFNALAASNRRLSSGKFANDNHEFLVETGEFLRCADDVSHVVVGVANGKPVFVRDVANVADSGEEPSDYVQFASGASGASFQPAVTLAISKRKGANAIDVAHDVLERVDRLKGSLIPSDVQVTITRNYGETAAEKSNELLWHMGIAVVSVSLLIALTLGFRESLIVFVAIPVTLALTLTVFYLYGYTLNRITLFALIFSIGILVDDAIVVVENIARHWRLPQNHGLSISEVAVRAVDEVGNPTILATLTVIAAILPMAFVGGLMGPYMRPIPVGASAAMIFSLMVAFMVTPWAAIRILNPAAHEHLEGAREDRLTRLYRWVMGGLLHKPVLTLGFLCPASCVLLLGSMALVYIGFVKVKMLPFDNKSEFQVIVDMPEGTTLEETARVTRQLADQVLHQPEVINLQTYIGTASPYNFNGLVRHYYLRSGSNIADIQVNLLPKGDRDRQSHEIAKMVRTALAAHRESQPGAHQGGRSSARPAGAGDAGGRSLRPRREPTDSPCPPDSRPVRQNRRRGGCGLVRRRRPAEDPIPRGRRESLAARHHRGPGGACAAHGFGGRLAPGCCTSIPRRKISRSTSNCARPERSSIDGLENLKIADRNGALVPLRELVTERTVTEDKSIYHKNLMPVTYVTGDVAGAMESPVYAILKLGPEISKIKIPEGYEIEQYTSHQPTDASQVRDEVGWRVAHHLRSVSRPGPGVRRGADPDLHPGGRLVPFVPDAAGDHGRDSVLAGWHSAGARAAARVLHRDVHDRLHRGRGHRGAEFDHPGGFRRAAAARKACRSTRP